VQYACDVIIVFDEWFFYSVTKHHSLDTHSAFIQAEVLRNTLENVFEIWNVENQNRCSTHKGFKFGELCRVTYGSAVNHFANLIHSQKKIYTFVRHSKRPFQTCCCCSCTMLLYRIQSLQSWIMQYLDRLDGMQSIPQAYTNWWNPYFNHTRTSTWLPPWLCVTADRSGNIRYKPKRIVSEAVSVEIYLPLSVWSVIGQYRTEGKRFSTLLYYYL
jgi:hypothetical protein